MSITQHPEETPLDPDDELLVSYLDGELSRAEESQLQDRLMEEEDLRNRLQQLQSGWDLLDDLPNPTPSLKLVESTLELVVADIVKTKPGKTQWLTRFRWPILIAIASLLGMTGVYTLASAIRTAEYEQQLSDLAVVEDLDAYMRGEDLELMRQLAASPDWSNMVAASRELGELEVSPSNSIALVPIDQRASRVGELPIEKLSQMNARWERFMGLNQSDREQVRRTAEAVSQQADAEFLLQTMRTYAIWIQTLDTEVRDKIESSDPTTRRQAIEESLKETQARLSVRSSLKLDEESIDWIYFGLQQILRQRVADGDPKTSKLLERVRERRQGDQDERYPVLFSIVFNPPQNRNVAEGSANRRRRPSFMAWSYAKDRPNPLTSNELSTIRFLLPDNAIDTLNMVAQGDPSLEEMALRSWAEETVRRKNPLRRKNDSTWLERYLELPSWDKDYIDLLPPKEILNTLSEDN